MNQLKKNKHLVWKKKNTKNYKINKKIRPNAFFGLKLCNNNIINELYNTQQELINDRAHIKKFLTSNKKFHITIGLLQLSDDDAIKLDEEKKCQAIINELNEYVESIKGWSLRIQGIGQFSNGRVLFSTAYDDGTLDKVVEFLKSRMIAHDLNICDENRKFQPHITLAKGIRNKKDDERIYGVNSELWKRLENKIFGEELVKEIALLAMKTDKETGYYPLFYESVPIVKL